MRLHRTLIALSLLAALSACTPGQGKLTETKPVPMPESGVTETNDRQR